MRISHLLKAWRHDQQMTVRDAAKEIGIPVATYHRVESGEMMGGEALAAVLRWALGRHN